MLSTCNSEEKIHLSDDAYESLKHVYGLINKGSLAINKSKHIRKREVLMETCGISEHTAKNAINMHNGSAFASERLLFDSYYNFAVNDILLYNNEHGAINTVRRTMAVLEQAYHIKVSYSVLLRDIRDLGFKNIKKELEETCFMMLEQTSCIEGVYVKERLANINDKLNPIQAEVFLDESYCHVDHSTQKTWVRPRGVVNESGRKPMLVIFAAFIVFKDGHSRGATIIPESVHVWPV